MIEVGRSEQMIKEMDKFASEDHTYNASKEEIEFYRGNWWIHTNVAHVDSVQSTVTDGGVRECILHLIFTNFLRYTNGYGKLRTSSRTT